MTCFALITFTTFPMLAIVDWKAHNKGKIWDSFLLAKISLKDFTITGITGNTLFWHIGAAYMVNFIVLALIYWSKFDLH
jgi:hypothetical protein